jgi:hypothetical protein
MEPETDLGVQVSRKYIFYTGYIQPSISQNITKRSKGRKSKLLKFCALQSSNGSFFSAPRARQPRDVLPLSLSGQSFLHSCYLEYML